MAAAAAALPVVASVLGGAAAIKSLTAKPPKAAKPIAMPDAEDQSAAKRRQIAAMQVRGGRASTILSDNETLG